ncbi:uncharacterized protein LOC102809088 [Saccoglossus kowalevskii]
MRHVFIYTGHPRPIYRQDLPADYIAYWELEVNDTDYVIISSSAKTGDYRLNQQGPLPSPTTLLDKYASSIQCQCHRYYMLSPDGQMYCQDEEDRIVAMTTENLIDIGKNDEYTKMDTLAKILFVQQDEIRAEWDQRRIKVEQSAVWSTVTKFNEALWDSYDDDNDVIDLFHSDSYSEQAISPGEMIQIPLGDVTHTPKVRFLPFEMNMTEEDRSEWQQRLCRVLLDICKVNSYTSIDETKVSVNHKLGRRSLELKLHDDEEFVKEILDGREIGFHIEIHLNNGEVILKRFGIDLSSHMNRYRRHTSTRPWNSWSYSEIKNEELFPDYWQHSVDGCMSGCGPVSWTMVFGYYDRLAHSSTPHGHSTALWRCGEDGTTGNDDCVAPATLNDTTKEYVEVVREQVDTFCLLGQGATPQWDMDGIAKFYQSRQGGSSHITTWNTGGPHGFLGWYSDQVANGIVNAIKDAQLPVVVGYRVGGKLDRQHYAVATKLRRRSRRFRHCYLFFCNDWKTEWDNDMYIHFGGQNGSGNGWRSCEGFFGGVAYPS